MKPGVSIIVPAYNCRDDLQRCLEALGEQDYPGPVDIVVVDNDSTDGTSEIARMRQGCRLVTCLIRGPAAARNAGLEIARYELVAFTDSDCVPSTCWITELERYMVEDVLGVGGPLEAAEDGWVQSLVAESSFDQESMMRTPLPYIATANAMFRRRDLVRVGGFDETFDIAGGEDNDLGWRLAAGSPRRFVFSRNATCLHRHAGTWLDYLSQRVRYGYGEALLARKHRDLAELRTLQPDGSGLKELRVLCARVRERLTSLRRRRTPRDALAAVGEVAFTLGAAIGRRKSRKLWADPTHRGGKGVLGCKPMCLKPWTSFELDDQNGNVVPCCWTKRILGNVNQATFEDVWNGPEYRRFREKMLTGDYADICPADCPHRTGAMREELPKAVGGGAFARNLELLEADIKEGRTELRAQPVRIRLLPSIQCNLECIMCWQRVEEDKRLPERFYGEIESRLQLVKTLTLQGGEPLMIKECRDLLRRAGTSVNTNLSVSLITNGTFLDRRFLDLVDGVRVDWILVSLDAATQKTYSAIRGAELESILGGVRAVIRERPDIRMILGFVVMSENVDEITDFIRLGEDLGVDVEFSPLNAAFRKEDDFADPRFRERLGRSIAEAEAFIGARGLRNQSLESVKVRSWNKQLASYSAVAEDAGAR